CTPAAVCDNRSNSPSTAREMRSMPELLTCPHGHQWEFHFDENTQSFSQPVTCPVCGAVLPLYEAAGRSLDDVIKKGALPIPRSGEPDKTALVSPAQPRTPESSSNRSGEPGKKRASAAPLPAA